MITKILAKDQYEIDEASNGFYAGLKIMRFMPTLIILDLFMPEMDGFEACRQLKAEPETQHIKIIAVLGFGSMENRNKIKELGADLFLEKPIEKQALLQSIKQFLVS